MTVELQANDAVPIQADYAGCGRKIGEFDCCSVVEGDICSQLSGVPSVELVITDPPYGIGYSSCGGPRVSEIRKAAIASETKLKNDVASDWSWAFSELEKRLLPASAIYCFTSHKNYCETVRWLSKFTMKTPLVWDKGNCGMGDLKGDYGCQTEFILYAVKGRHILQGGRNRNILNYQRPSDAHRNHPTEKPVELLQYLIGKSSVSKQIVLDPFCGSGPTLIAAKRLGRHFLGIEIEPKYVAIARERLAAEPWVVERV